MVTGGNLVIERGQLKGAVDGFELDTCKDGACRSGVDDAGRPGYGVGERRSLLVVNLLVLYLLLSWVPSFHDVLGNILAGHVQIVFSHARSELSSRRLSKEK